MAISVRVSFRFVAVLCATCSVVMTRGAVRRKNMRTPSGLLNVEAGINVLNEPDKIGSAWDLVPGEGMMLGVTNPKEIINCTSPIEDCSPSPDEFQKATRSTVQIWRSFKFPDKPELTESEKAFINSGGLFLYTTQGVTAENGTHLRDWPEELHEDLTKYANVVKSVAPHKVVVMPGFEPELHISDDPWNEEHHHDIWGSAEDYRKMYKHYYDTFKAQGVDNVLWAFDFSVHAYGKEGGVIESVWPDDSVQVDWLFFNLFQTDSPPKDGSSCSDMLDQQYKAMERIGKSKGIPWGLGAWGTRNMSKNMIDPLDSKDRVKCMLDMKEAFESGKYPKVKAAVYFNSLFCTLSEGKSPPALIAAVQELHSSTAFVVPGHGPDVISDLALSQPHVEPFGSFEQQ